MEMAPFINKNEGLNGGRYQNQHKTQLLNCTRYMTELLRKEMEHHIAKPARPYLEGSRSLAVKRLTSLNESNVVKGPVQVLVIFAISSETPRTETNLTEIEPYQENSAF